MSKLQEDDDILQETDWITTSELIIGPLLVVVKKKKKDFGPVLVKTEKQGHLFVLITLLLDSHVSLSVREGGSLMKNCLVDFVNRYHCWLIKQNFCWLGPWGAPYSIGLFMFYNAPILQITQLTWVTWCLSFLYLSKIKKRKKIRRTEASFLG